MEKDSANHLNMLLRVPLQQKDDLACIRHWQNLKLAAADGWCWVKDFTAAQHDAVELKTLPFKNIFYLRGNQLFPAGSLLPATNLPGGLLWTPIEAALPVAVPNLNHNFFGMRDEILVRLVPAAQEWQPIALVADIVMLEDYITNAPAIRLQKLAWALLLPGRALIAGTPLLPVQGTTYWLCEDMLLPTGYHFEWPVLAKTIAHNIDPISSNWILWNTEGGYNLIPRSSLQQLSISSFRLSIRMAATHHTPNT
jgi:MoxR-vWA-beta-propeller ternary system domain bpX2